MIRRLKNKLTYYVNVLRSLVAKIFMPAPKVLSAEETINLIVNHHYSLSRNGDGEVDIMIGQSIPFQNYDPRLAQIMHEAIRSRRDGYLSAIPNIFGDYSYFNDKAKTYYDRYLKTKRWAYYKYIDGGVYGNAFISRFYIDYIDKSQAYKRFEMLKSIWEKQDILLVEGKDSRLGVNNDMFDNAARLRRILGPSENAFSRYDEIKSAVKSNSKTDTLILLALGPTATAMSYELAKDGYWAVDIGHIDIEYEWMRMGATSKVPVPGKYTNEAIGNKLIGLLPENAVKKYTEEIICKIL